MNKAEMLKEMTNNISGRTADIISACNAYEAAQANLKAVQELTNECKREVLTRHTFTVEEQFKGKRGLEAETITDPTQDYLMSEEDFKKYLDLLYPLYIKAGIDDPRGVNYCPDAIPREELKNAENNLLDVFLTITPGGLKADFEKMRNHWKYRQKLIDLALNMANLEAVKEA